METRRQRQIREQQEALLAQQPHPPVPNAALLLPLPIDAMQAAGAAGVAGAVPPAGGVAAAAGAVAPAGGAGAIAGVPIFARAPAEIVQQGYLDLSDRNQCQIYTNGMKPLQALDSDRFDCKEPNLKKFLDFFDHREAHMGWRTLFTITLNGVGRHIPHYAQRSRQAYSL